MVMILPNTHLLKLRNAFQAKGHDLWFVGGCVRDALRNEDPKDVDLCTDANPDEQIEIYKANGYTFIPTGLQHGTITVKMDDTYEITSLRTESEHDGRRAVCSYTRDLKEDLSRRDLTINAIAQDFDGNIIDPFGGVSDLNSARVRFVGDAHERMNEDYLRILRFFRFHARFAGLGKLDEEATDAIYKIVPGPGLEQISGERIWQEMKKIILGRWGAVTFIKMQRMKILETVKCHSWCCERQFRAEVFGVKSAPAIIGFSMTEENVRRLANRWVLSNSERSEAMFIARHRTIKDREFMKELLVDGVDYDWVSSLIAYHRLESLADWKVPIFPVNGNDIMKRGIKAGRAVGLALAKLRSEWKASNYKLTKDQLLTNT